ncbi:MAG TPA: aldo/keto reductase [Gemmatimonadaceae bacterium]|jgi:aryl-alcohol dehydrogenase-like predicted oxidoreductase|nr:aldo/keto reductase [Gemmatimonadaceae bacterium]
MQTRRIGTLEVSVIGVGCNNFGQRIDDERTREVIDAAIDSGINFFDTADMYANGKSEQLLGRFLGKRRRDVVVATKFGNDMPGQGRGARPEYVKQALDASLKRLGTDYVDLYQQHVPDPDVPIAETLGALDEMVKAGKVREIGCSNFSAEQLRDAQRASDARKGSAHFVSVQNEYSLLHREPEEEVLGECTRQGLAFLPFFPLKSGLLTGKYRKGTPIPPDTRIAKYERYKKLLTEENLEKVEALAEFAESKHRTLLELAFSWLLTRKSVASVIAGASSADQVRKNVSAADWDLSPSELDEVDLLLRAAV